MPDDGDSDFDELVDDDCDVCDASDITVSAVNSVDKTCATAGKHEVMHMPPGSIFEQWRQFKELGFSHDYKLFWSVWKKDFDFLKLRGKRSHGQCSICVSHKLLIRSFSNDVRARLKQRHLYDNHLKHQYEDRQTYWNLRAQSRLLQRIGSS